MAILNIGSINWDRVYNVDHFPQPGETMSSLSSSVGLGGKGLNQSIAILRSGGDVRHLGAVGAGDASVRNALGAEGLSLDLIEGVDGCETGSAMILVDRAGENLIVLDPGANHRIPERLVRDAVAGMSRSGWALFQNETNVLGAGVRAAREAGLRVAVAAAPFDAAAVVPFLNQINLLAVNEIEFRQLCEAAGGDANLPDGLSLLVTLGADGAEYRAAGETVRAAAFRVEVVDTTGAGDTVLGAFLARLDLGASVEEALSYAMAAGAVQVTRPGAAPAIPTVAEVEAFLARTRG